MSSKSIDTFNVSQSRLRAATFQDEEERQNAEYAERHNLQALFSEFAAQLREKDPKSEHEAERVLLDLLSHRKAERDRAALRLHFDTSFEVNRDNGRKVLKLITGPETSTLHIMQKTRSFAVDDTFTVSLEEAEELTDTFYELGRFVVESAKGEPNGFISIDDRDVYLLANSKECSEVVDELFNMVFIMKVSNGN
ncbi:hypothetical protein JKF63_00091 [Porcisia hertigi]|uniref:Uncharacterized protein n=1 Tax=Porcisia hertigi TaxID=2761500 RepID=A0A836GXM5_9TRYP|nr:hypothetical protein JKF63_00091 [Porcisia hertigi]